MDIWEIEALARSARERSEEMEKAIVDERAARGVLLRNVLRVVEPCLDTVVSKVIAAEEGHAIRDHLVPDRREHFNWRGVLVGGDPVPRLRRDVAKRVGGRVRIVEEKLASDGLYIGIEPGGFFGFVGVRYKGEVRHDGSYAWSGTGVFLTIAEVAGSRWGAEDVCESLAKALVAQVGGKERAVEKASSAAAALRKAAEILRSA